MTTRLDKMEEAGMIRRLADPDDRRGVLVELTEHGRDLWQQSVAVQAEKETAIAAALSEREKQELNELLRKLVHAFREAHGPLKRR
jgi:DNA-binding MarR family transcriptional regulator